MNPNRQDPPDVREAITSQQLAVALFEWLHSRGRTQLKAIAQSRVTVRPDGSAEFLGWVKP